MDTLIINQLLPIRKALEILDGSHTKTLFVVNDSNRLQGSLTDGDIRRWILKNGNINGTVLEACNTEPFVLNHPVERAKALKMMQENHLHAAPVIDKNGHVIRVVLRDELSGGGTTLSDRMLTDVPVVIMAGGKGTRLDPFTRILPKPLIPVGNQPVIELIMQQFARFGVNTFYISLNHQARLIRAYFEEQQYPYIINFIEEEMPLGTAGSLKMLENKYSGDLFLSNCDVIIKSDYAEMMKFHREGGFELTVTTAVHHYAIPYGVCEADENGHLLRITEKPEYTMLINTGMYILKSDVLSLIPENRMFHVTDLIEILRQKNKPVGVFPVPHDAYHDIGQWEEYRNALPFLT